MNEIQLCRLLMRQLKEASGAVQETKVHAEGSKAHRKLVELLSKFSGGILVPVTLSKGRLQTDLSPGSLVGKEKVSSWDTFDEALNGKEASPGQERTLGLSELAKQAGMSLERWNGVEPEPRDGVGSGKYECFVVTVPPGSSADPGVYVVPFVPILAKGGKTTLASDKMRGYAAEWAVWFALGGMKTPAGSDEGFAKFMASSLNDESLFSSDKRLSDAWANSRIADRESFMGSLREMTENLLGSMGALDGARVDMSNPPTGGSGAVDMKARLRNGKNIDISVKWGPTERLGGSRLSSIGSSSGIFMKVSREPAPGITWRRDKNPIKGRTPIEPSIDDALDRLEREADWEKSLLAEAREWLGIVEGAATYVIVQFDRKNSPKVTLPDGDDSVIVELRRGKNFGNAYYIDVLSDAGRALDVLRVELRFTDNKYVQWHKGKNFTKTVIEPTQHPGNPTLETRLLLQHLLDP